MEWFDVTKQQRGQGERDLPRRINLTPKGQGTGYPF